MPLPLKNDENKVILLYCPPGFGIPDYKHKNTISKINIFSLSPTSFFFYPFPPLPYLFRPSYLPCVFIQYFSPFFSLLLSHFSTSIPHVLNCLSLLIAHSAPSFLSFHPIPVFSFFVPTSKSRLHFSFFCTFSPPVLRNFTCYTPLILPVVSGFFDYFHFFFCVFVPFTQLYIYPSSFCS
jgi:hypothetical protein